MNLDQFLGMVRNTLPIVIPALVTGGVVPAGTPTTLGGLGLLAASWVWSYIAHSDSAKIAAVTALPDVTKILTVRNPINTDVKAASGDVSQPKVSPVQ